MSDAMRFFAIFFLTLGPLKTIPIFFVISQRMEPPQRWKLALRATGTATIIALAVAFGGYALIQRWGVSVPAVQLGGGILILIGAIDVIRSFKLREPPQSLADTEPHTPQEKRALARRISLSPLAVPTIVTSYGVVAILLAMSLFKHNWEAQLTIVGLILLMMALNFVAMGCAPGILKYVGFTNLQVAGWVIAVMQVMLAAEVILAGLNTLQG